MAYTYIQAIGHGFPAVQCHASGDGSVYTDIVWDSGAAMPTQQELDNWIAANPAADTTKLTVLAFRNRFTQAEKIAIEMASLDNPSASTQARMLAASLRVMNSDLSVATFVDINRADTIAGVQALETYGIIGTGRANIILNTPATALEINPLI
jgi:hypothetical protein